MDVQQMVEGVLIMSQLEKLKFLKQSEHYTVDQARAVIRILFPTKSSRIYRRRSSYGFKHLLEEVSELFTDNRFYKYCSNNTLIQAFKMEGYKLEMRPPNALIGLSIKEVNLAYKIVRPYS